MTLGPNRAPLGLSSRGSTPRTNLPLPRGKPVGGAFRAAAGPHPAGEERFLLDNHRAFFQKHTMLYEAANTHRPHSLAYSWSAWPQKGTALPVDLPGPTRSDLGSAWRKDGMELQSLKLESTGVLATFRVDPTVSPVFCAGRAKGRLQHALRSAGNPCAFSRKVSVRALGHNITSAVVHYVRDQLAHVDLADPRYRDELGRSAFEELSVDLNQPVELRRSRYWYGLHLVLVTAERYRMGGDAFLPRLRDALADAVHRTGSQLRSIAIMPDHVHLAMKGDPERSPLEIGLAVQNDSAKAAGFRLWQDSFYMGSFCAYDLSAIRG